MGDIVFVFIFELVRQVEEIVDLVAGKVQHFQQMVHRGASLSHSFVEGTDAREAKYRLASRLQAVDSLFKPLQTLVDLFILLFQVSAVFAGVLKMTLVTIRITEPAGGLMKSCLLYTSSMGLSVLRSNIAIQASVLIVRAFVAIRQLIANPPVDRVGELGIC